MSVSVRFASGRGPTTDQYDETIRRLEEAGDFPPDGMEYDVCFLQDGNCASARSGTRASSWTPSASG